jgi:hypothetical protein
MKRRESGKSARHARWDGWRAPLLAMLKYCRHKATAEDRHSTISDERERKIAPGQNVHHDSRTIQQIRRDYCIPVFVKTHGSDVAMRPKPTATRCRGA